MSLLFASTLMLEHLGLVLKASSTRIRIFLTPQLFLSGYAFRLHVSGEFASEAGTF